MDKIKKFPDLHKLSRAAAEYIVTLSKTAIRERGRFTLALSGGSTPETLYALLATEAFAPRIDWSKVHIFWGDERCVPPDHKSSNYRMAKYALLEHVPLSEKNIHRVLGERNPHEAALLYERDLNQFFETEEGWPRFDLILLGLGDDGHTASLFPHTYALEVNDRWVVENHVEHLDSWRVTLTAPAINAAEHIMFMVIGKQKALRVYEILQGESQPNHLPAQLIHPTNGTLVWLLDEEAGSLV
jgi:6-phosphogluconolactonase